jgi:ParB family transcriptional regulator, chromosome partitioning protein
MSGPSRGLGRGLEALIPTTAAAVAPGELPQPRPGAEHPPAAPAEGGTGAQAAFFSELPVDAIGRNPRQPRAVFDEDEMAELAMSIKEVGLLQPIVVRPVEDGSYELVMGERRWRAARQAGLRLIPAIVRRTSDDDLLRDALLENLHRSQLNPLEEAAAYSQLLDDFGCTHDVLAQRLGRSRPQISNTIRLLRLPAGVQRRVAAGVLSAGHARALLSIEEPTAQEALAARVVAEGISVRGLEELIAVGPAPRPTPRQSRPREVPPELAQISERLAERLETRCTVEVGRRSGKLVIEFASAEDLRRMIAMLEPNLLQ